MSTQVATARLELLPIDHEVADAAISGDRMLLEMFVGAHVPADWPGDVGALLTPYAAKLAADCEELGWGPWLAVDPALGQVVGDLGFKGRPGPDGIVELGFSTVEAHRRKGYASEAGRALVTWALEQPGVTDVLADCLPDNTGSIRTLERIGFTRVGERDELLRWSYSAAR